MKYLVPAILIFIIVLLLIYFIKCYNRFIKLRNRVRDQASQIDVQLKRRCDLIPNLVETVKGCASFERETLEAVIAARQNVMSGKSLQETANADAGLNNALHRLLAVSESYPELKASSNFAALQKELSETEDKIAKNRQFYNDTVLKYNDGIQMFPASLVAKCTGFKELEFLQIADKERENVKVSF